jgi:cytochrome c biogenesis protein CcmG, thiol:disulfide interchange protein DsbE
LTVVAGAPATSVTRGRRRTVLWIAGAVGVVFAALIATLAFVGSSNSSSPLKGKPAPALSGSRINSKGTVSLGQYSGKWVLVNFGASWCIPCQEEMPQLVDFAKVASRYNAVLITVEMQASDIPDMRKLLASDDATWPAITAGTAAVRWGVKQIPTTYIINPAGYVSGDLQDGLNATGVETAIAKASGES